MKDDTRRLTTPVARAEASPGARSGRRSGWRRSPALCRGSPDAAAQSRTSQRPRQHARAVVRSERDRAGREDTAQGRLGARGDGGAPRADRARQPEGQRHRHAGGGARAGRRGPRGRTASLAARPLGVLHGLPVAHKDLVDTAGIRTTRGSPFYRDHVPTRDALIVTRIRAAGAITCGKTNTPEFGAGSQTFNSVFGATRNPYDVTKTCGGSSGGAAVALACGMVPIADGSDTGGSLRNPAAFCNVVGFRPSPGRVPGECGQLVAAVGVGPDGAVGRRRGAVPERDGRAGSAQPALDRGGRRPVSRAARSRFQGRARRVVAGPRRHSVRTGDPPGRRRQPPRVREPRLRRRGGRAGFRRRRSGVSGAALHRPIIRSMRRSSGSGPNG